MPDQIIDLATLSDEALDTLRAYVLTEQERRSRLVQIPAQIADLAQRYLDDGGDLNDISLPSASK